MAARAAELFLSHRLFRSLSDGQVIDRRWLALHYPPYWLVGWPGGVAPPGSHRSRREPLGSPGSCRPGHQAARFHCQWANMPGSRRVMPSQHRLAFLDPCSRLCFLRSQRIR
jgi:hypothetical protein